MLTYIGAIVIFSLVLMVVPKGYVLLFIAAGVTVVGALGSAAIGLADVNTCFLITLLALACHGGLGAIGYFSQKE